MDQQEQSHGKEMNHISTAQLNDSIQQLNLNDESSTPKSQSSAFDQTNNQIGNQHINQPTTYSAQLRGINDMQLFRYSFIMQTLTPLLTDRDVLARLLLTGKTIRPFLVGYRLKSAVRASASGVAGFGRYLPVNISRIRDAGFQDLSMYKHLEEVHYWMNVHYCTDAHVAIKPEWLPASVKVIRFDENCFTNIQPGTLPFGLRELRLGDCSATPLVVGSIPNSVEIMDLRRYEHELQPGVIPLSVTSLTMNYVKGNLFLPGILPSSLKKLRIGRINPKLSSRLSAMPLSLEHKTNSQSRNQSYRLRLPSSLISLTTPGFSHPLQVGDLPESLTELDIVYDSDMPIVLPKSIVKLSVCCSKSYLMIPDSVKQLTVRSYSIHAIPPGFIPTSVQKLDLHCFITKGSIPTSVKHLLVQSRYWCDDVPIGAFPTSLETLLLLGKFNQDIEAGLIPDGVKELVLGVHFNSKISVGSIPQSIEKLIMIEPPQYPLLSGAIPDSVTSLQIGDSWSTPQASVYAKCMGFQVSDESLQKYEERWQSSSFTESPGSIPTSVTTLNISDKYSKRLIPGVIPESVTFLNILGSEQVAGWDYMIRFDLKCGVIPSSVVSLRLPFADIRFEQGSVPNTVKDLYVHHHFQVPSDVKARVTYEIEKEYQDDNDDIYSEDDDDDYDDDDCDDDDYDILFNPYSYRY